MGNRFGRSKKRRLMKEIESLKAANRKQEVKIYRLESRNKQLLAEANAEVVRNMEAYLLAIQTIKNAFLKSMEKKATELFLDIAKRQGKMEYMEMYKSGDLYKIMKGLVANSTFYTCSDFDPTKMYRILSTEMSSVRFNVGIMERP